MSGRNKFYKWVAFEKVDEVAYDGWTVVPGIIREGSVLMEKPS